MTGTKFGRAMALCGACTVYVDGVATRSCITAIDGISDSRVTTIEAIGAPPPGAKLEVDLKQAQPEHAPPNEKFYAKPMLGVQATGNSNAMRGAWKPLREAGATARTRPVAAAAERCSVAAKSRRPQDGEVAHAPTGRRLTYGELAAAAAKLPVQRDCASDGRTGRHHREAERFFAGRFRPYVVLGLPPALTIAATVCANHPFGKHEYFSTASLIGEG